MYNYRVASIPLLATAIGACSIGLSLLLSIHYETHDWARRLWYVSQFAGKFPNNIPFIMGMHFVAVCIYVIIEMLCFKLRKQCGARGISYILKLFSCASAVSLALLSVVSTYESSKMHNNIVAFFFACAGCTSLYVLIASCKLKKQNKSSFSLTCTLQLLCFLGIAASLATLGIVWFIVDRNVYRDYGIQAEYSSIFFLFIMLALTALDLKDDVIIYAPGEDTLLSM
ncbi:hypothetical protein RCL1_000824 [Eukaryota sp. TZLM3-RCL]